MKQLGGYQPQVGRNPIPSLLQSLLSEHLDPGYAEARRRRAAGAVRSRTREWCWRALAVSTVAVVAAAAVAQTQSVAPAARQAQQVLAATVRATQSEIDRAVAERDTLTAQVDDIRRSRLAGDELGRRLLAALDDLGVAAAATAVTGPGVMLTLTEPGAVADLSDVSKQRVTGSRQVILDRDLQLVVNSLWVSGAEAISVGQVAAGETAAGGTGGQETVRIGPGVTIRQAGGAILVDNQPITSPYEVLAVGPPNTMADAFERSPGMHRLRLLESSYGVGVSTSAREDLTLPAGTVREVNFATRVGP